MAIAKRPSTVTLPNMNRNGHNLLSFLTDKFPFIAASLWVERIQQNKLHWSNGDKVTLNTPFIPGRKLCYYREVKQEPKIPFQHDIIYQDDFILVACKPHFLPVTPGGQYVNECLLERLRQQTNLKNITPLHRLDRLTAGLVLFSHHKPTRGRYAQLFAHHQITKSYEAVAPLSPSLLTNPNTQPQQQWHIANRLEKSLPTFTMHEVQGEVNARSTIILIKKIGHLGYFNLTPTTGKTHQLRLHMAKIGMPILNDNFYPNLQAQKPINFNQPLQLLAKSLSFTDPVSKKAHHFHSPRHLFFKSHL